jgi:diazepam-binding inhibitor (GABA receptor modulator, acyl-CoA-binding protein)
MAIKDDFENAAKAVQTFSQRPSDSDLLKLYGLYKQATEGPVKGSRPGIFDIKGRKKFDSWAELKQMPADEAMQKYVALVGQLKSDSAKHS